MDFSDRVPDHHMVRVVNAVEQLGFNHVYPGGAVTVLAPQAHGQDFSLGVDATPVLVAPDGQSCVGAKALSGVTYRQTPDVRTITCFRARMKTIVGDVWGSSPC